MDSNNFNNSNSGVYETGTNTDTYTYAAPEMGTPVVEAAPVANPNNGMAIGSLVCGIVGLVSCCCCGLGAIVGIVGVVLAILSKKKNDGKFSGLAVAGLVCSILAILSGVGYLIYAIASGVMAPAMLEGYNNAYDSTYYNY